MQGETRRVLLDDVRQAAEKVSDARDALDDARAELHEAIRRAVAEGISKAAVARAAGLSNERVGQIVRAE